MNIIIDIYIFICLMLLLFNISFLLVKNFRNKKFYPEDNKMRKFIREEMENYRAETGLSDSFITFLDKDIRKTKNLIVLQKELSSEEIYPRQMYKDILVYIGDKVGLYKTKTEYEQAYYAYVISSFDYDGVNLSASFYEEFLTFLDSRSLYVFSNAMDGIYRFSNPYLMSLAIDKVDERGGFYHNKLFVDGLLRFKGDSEILQELMIKNFYDYSSLTQESILDYFRFKGGQVEDLCMAIIDEGTLGDEVLYSAMRYFIKYPNEKSRGAFIKILNGGEKFWIEELLAIQALSTYKDDLIRELIKTRLTSKSWYIRIAAVEYFYRSSLEFDEIDEILSLRDKYTNESLLYYYRDNEEASNYIIEAIGRFELENSVDDMTLLSSELI